MVIIQLLILLLILPIAYGPLGHLGLGHGAPELLVIAVWLFSWLTDRRTGLRFALLAGIAADLLGFHRFGLMTLELVGLALLIDLFRSRFFNVSSYFEALLTLLIVTVINILYQALISAQFDWRSSLISIIANLILGFLLYYVLAVWLRLFQRWRGQRL